MPKILTQAQIDTFWRDGCVFPIRVMSSDEALAIRAQARGVRARAPAARSRATCATSRTCSSRGSTTSCATRTIVDAIEDLYGPDLLCWTTNFFIKEAQQPGVRLVAPGLDLLGPRQARRRDRLGRAHAEQQEPTARWASFPARTPRDQIPHRDTFAKNNLLTRGQEVAVDVDASEGGDDRARAGRDVAAPRAPGARLAAESVERPAHRLRDPLHPDAAWRRSPATTARRWCAASTASTTSTSSRGRARDMDPAFVAAAQGDRRAQRADPLPRHRREELQRPRGAAGAGGVTAATNAAKARLFRQMHLGPEILVIANAWDAGSARVFEEAGIRAVGTGSAGVAFSHGYRRRRVHPARRDAARDRRDGRAPSTCRSPPTSSPAWATRSTRSSRR